MTGRVFVDTNVLIYARDRRNPVKHGRAREWLSRLGETGLGLLNLQVLNEFTRWVLANEGRRPLEDVRGEIELLRTWGDKPLDEEEVDLAWSVRQRYGFQWFDCLLVAAAARHAECRFFLTEDMSPGALFGAVTLIDPFQTAPTDILIER